MADTISAARDVIYIIADVESRNRDVSFTLFDLFGVSRDIERSALAVGRSGVLAKLIADDEKRAVDG